jgi:hypothetical protein
MIVIMIAVFIIIMTKITFTRLREELGVIHLHQRTEQVMTNPQFCEEIDRTVVAGLNIIDPRIRIVIVMNGFINHIIADPNHQASPTPGVPTTTGSYKKWRTE